MSKNQDHIEPFQLADPHKFDQRFIELTHKTTTYEEAYEQCESEHESAWGKKKYSSYNSYRNTRTKRMKQKQTL